MSVGEEGGGGGELGALVYKPVTHESFALTIQRFLTFHFTENLALPSNKRCHVRTVFRSISKNDSKSLRFIKDL